MTALTALDWGVMAAYGAVVLAIGWIANRRQRDSEDYFLGGRRMPWWVVGVSLVATSFSSASLIGGTSHGYRIGMQWMAMQLGDFLGLAAACLLFLPFFAGLRLTTAYEYLERRFGPRARIVASLLFLGQTLLRTSLLVYAPAVALAALLGWTVESAILATAVAALLYSAAGGIGAVVWTDLIQMAVIVFAVAYSLVVVAGDVPEGLGQLVGRARGHGRLAWASPGADPKDMRTLLGATVPYAVFAFSLFGTGQQAVQRFLSVRDLRAARRAALLGWGVGAMSICLTLFLGACLASWAEIREAPLLAATDDPNAVLPHFIGRRLPAGLAGLLLAAIFAAAMSSLDSAIHSMSTAFLVDFRRRFVRVDPARELRAARVYTALFGLMALVGALYAARRTGGAGLLETMATWLGYFAGPLLGLFLLGVLFRRANETGALLGVGTAFLAVVGYVWLFPEPFRRFHPLWLAPASCAVTVGLGLLASLPGRPPDPRSLKGLTWSSRPRGGAGSAL